MREHIPDKSILREGWCCWRTIKLGTSILREGWCRTTQWARSSCRGTGAEALTGQVNPPRGVVLAVEIQEHTLGKSIL